MTLSVEVEIVYRFETFNMRKHGWTSGVAPEFLALVRKPMDILLYQSKQFEKREDAIKLGDEVREEIAKILMRYHSRADDSNSLNKPAK